MLRVKRKMAACEVDALDLLKRRGRDVADIIRVETDSILYLDSKDRPWTAWLRKQNAAKPVEVACEPGFCAERSVEFPDWAPAGS